MTRRWPLATIGQVRGGSRSPTPQDEFRWNYWLTGVFGSSNENYTMDIQENSFDIY